MEGGTDDTARQALAESYRRRGFWKRETLPARAAAVVENRAGRAAIADDGRRFTFAEAAALIERLAGHLTALGVDPGHVVSWQLPNWWEAAIVHHAALRVGATPNPLNPIFRARELRYVLAEARPHVLFVPASFRRFDYAELARRLQVDRLVEHVVVARGEAPFGISLDALLDEPAQPAPIPLARPSDPALLLYTSGTTSNPKGVLHSHETLLYEIDSLREIHAITPDDCYLGGSPVTHIAGLVYGVLMPFALGTRTAMLDRWDPKRALALIASERATFQTGAPTFLQTLAEHHDPAKHDLSSFRLFSTGGANIPTEAIRSAERTLGCRVKRAYGSTEVPTLTATTFEDPDQERLGTDGRAIGAAEIRIAGADGVEVPAGDEGEIWARSPEVFLGYRNPALDAGCFTEDGWFRTGDLGRVGADGYLRVTGRLSELIIRGGENISVKEVEDLLAEHPAVADVAIVGMPDPVLGERACAFVAARRGSRFTFEEMTAYLESREIARQKIPERLVVRASLPKTTSGKVLKQALRAELERA